MTGYLILSFAVGYAAAFVATLDQEIVEYDAEYLAGVFVCFAMLWVPIIAFSVIFGALWLIGKSIEKAGHLARKYSSRSPKSRAGSIPVPR